MRAGGDQGEVPADRNGPVHSRGQRTELAALGVVDPHETVMLHQHVPDVPGEYEDHQSVQAPEIEPQRRQKDEGRRQQEPQTVAGKQLPVAVGADESRQMMTEGKESQQQERVLLRLPIPA